MAFDDFPSHPTQYFLGEVPLWYCNFDYPVLRRGVQPVEITLFQPSDMYEDLRLLSDNQPVSLRVVEAGRGGGRRETEIKGILVKDVQLVQANSVDGCRVVLSDIREWIDLQGPWVHDINLVESGKLVLGTGRSTDGGGVEPHTLKSFWTEVLVEDAPFQGNMAPGFDIDIEDDLLIPPDNYRSGGLRSEVLQQLLEFWQYDLVLSPQARFYVANRKGDDPAALGQFAEGDWEWADEEPNFSHAVAPHLRAKKYIVPFYERHTLQCWHDWEGLGGTVAGDRRPAIQMFQVYRTMDDFWRIDALFRIFGREVPDALTLENLKKTFTKYLLGDTALDRTKHLKNFEEEEGADKGSAEYVAEERRHRALIKAFQESERRFFKIQARAEVPGHVGARDGNWTEIELGRLRPDGTMAPTRAYGDAAILYRRIDAADAEPAPSPSIGPYVGVNLTGRITFRDGKKVALTADELGVLGPGAQGRDYDEFAEFAEAAEDRPWTINSANPIQPAWISKEGLVIRLNAVKAEVTDDQDIYIGTMDRIPGTRDFDFTNEETTKDRAETIKEEGLDEVSLPKELRADIVWNPSYPFYFFVAAKRNAPQTMDKFWTVEVDGFGDAKQDEIVLLPDDHVEMRRNFVDAVDVNEGLDPMDDGLGQPMNLEQVEAQAERRVRTVKSISMQPTPTQHTFYNINRLLDMRLRGAIDQVVLRVRGVRVECEASVGARAEDSIRRLEAELQRNRIRTEFRGKVATR